MHSKLLVAAATFALVMVAGPLPAPAASPGFRLAFDGASLAAGSNVPDVSGAGHSGKVKVRNGGSLKPVAGVDGTAARFPAKCTGEACPRALITIPDAPDLDPGPRPFEWGADIRLGARDTSDGQNVVQQGTWGEPGGQWKLQVDKAAGRPSCVVAGTRNGEMLRVVVISSVSIADGSWHRVICRREGGSVSIEVDGTRRGAIALPTVDVSPAASVSIGAKSLSSGNDQFHGDLDNVFLSFL